MRKFILVDHSLRDTGGHHHPYALSVLHAAEAAGFAPVLVTHREFREHDALPAHWSVHPLFPDVSYSPHTLDTQGPSRPDPWPPAPVRGLLRGLARARHVRRFASACSELMHRVAPVDGDIVFLPTASELDLAGLAAFLGGTRLPGGLRWHAQLHFGIHRAPDWHRAGNTAAAAAMRASLGASLARCGDQRPTLWCTTAPLAAQYRALGLADVDVLPYPVHELFAQWRTWQPAPRPARIACLGHARREKNQRALPAVVEALWQEAFAPGRARLVVQNARHDLRRALADTVRRLGGAAGEDPVDCSAGRLESLEYAQLVCGSDIGLLLYDARRYHDRCSGVLLEMLVAAVPVIVPAGCWLADQLDAAEQAWLAECEEHLRTAGQLHPMSLPPGATVALPEGATGLLVCAQARARADGGSRLRIAVGTATGETSHGALHWQSAAAESPLYRLLPLPAGATSARADPTDHSLRGAMRVQAITGPLPARGALGIAIDAPGDAPAALRDILGHIEHYKRHAAKWAGVCAEASSAARIIERLLERP